MENVFEPAKPDVDIPKRETEILEFWNQKKIFEKSLIESKGKPYFSFYDGPPFATGLPHYGHLLAGTLKDIVPRYWTMKGFHVPRRFGWDCHGLPVEHEINKTLKIESRKQILEMGIGTYNAHCKSIVKRYAREWKQTVARLGRWVDMDNAYYTMDASFMQSVWWVFKQLWEKGLVYEDYKVVPYSTGISTALSNFEANLNYKEVQDPAITVKFKINEWPNTYILAWTTTPWTLPSNLGLAVKSDIVYSRIKNSQGDVYILAKNLVSQYGREFWGEAAKDKIALENLVRNSEEILGRELLGLTYEPILPYFEQKKNEGAFRVIESDHVTVDSGTGVVHMAPAFGEDDFFACKKAGIGVVNPVDDDGMFTAEIFDFVGRRVKDADKDIIALLKSKGVLFKQDTLVHSYPFCWRTNTPLIYRAVPNWFVSVEKIKESIVAANKKTRWVPEHLRDGRFGNWLENARDWAVSRSRFWGTPIPIWKNKEGETICVGSMAELEKLTGKKVDDLHLENIKNLEIESKTGQSPLRLVDFVLDCWFESGSMPYAQYGYPFQNKEGFEKAYPADFIAEGLDQTRGWFYTLMVIGAALNGRSPFDNVLVNGIIVAEDGKKMSKSLRNYPDPNKLIDLHGSDALRLYMIDSPVVKAQELRFSEKGVNDIVRRIMLRWWNAYSFFVSYANVDKFIPANDYHRSPNILDRWVLSRLNTLIENTNEEMEAYRLYNVVPGLLNFIEDLTNTYIRFNRGHFWQNGMPEDKRLAYETLYHVLRQLSCLMAPFAPFMSETIYKNLARAAENPKESVHLESYPETSRQFLKPHLEVAVKRMNQIVMMGRNLREQMGIKAKIPLNHLRIVFSEEASLKDIKSLQTYIAEELNVKEVIYDNNEQLYVDVTAKANFPILGPRLGPKMKSVAQGIQKLLREEIAKLENGEVLVIAGESIQLQDVEIRRTAKSGVENIQIEGSIAIQMDSTVSESQIREGLSREIIRRIQLARKAAQLNLDDRILLQVRCEGELKAAAEAHREGIMNEVLATEMKMTDDLTLMTKESTDVDGVPLEFSFEVQRKSQPSSR